VIERIDTRSREQGARSRNKIVFLLASRSLLLASFFFSVLSVFSVVNSYATTLPATPNLGLGLPWHNWGANGETPSWDQIYDNNFELIDQWVGAHEIGTNVQPYSPNLTIFAGITPSANVRTFLAAPNFAAMLSDLGAQPALGFTAENIANKDQNGGYVGRDSSGNASIPGNFSAGSETIGSTVQTVQTAAQLVAAANFAGTVVVTNSIMLTGNLTMTAGLDLRYTGQIVLGNYNLAINGPFQGSLGCFVQTGTGLVSFGTPVTADPRWFGAEFTSGIDDTAAWNALIAVVNAGSVKAVSIPAGTSYVSRLPNQIIPPAGFSMIGAGIGSSRIIYTGSASGDILHFGGTYPISGYSAYLFSATIQGFTVQGSGATGVVGMEVVGMQNCVIRDVEAYNPYVGGTGFLLRGHSESQFYNLVSISDMPLALGPATTAVGDGVDHFSFHGLDLYSATNNNPLITVLSTSTGGGFGTLSFTGMQAWIGGNAGFQYIQQTGSTAGNAGNVSFENIRREDNPLTAGIGINAHASGYGVDIEMLAANAVQKVNLRTCQLSSNNGSATLNGVKLVSGYVSLLMEGYMDGGGSGQVGIYATSSGPTDTIELIDSNMGGSTLTLTGFKLAFQTNLHQIYVPYSNPAATSVLGLVYPTCGSWTVVNNATPSGWTAVDISSAVPTGARMVWGYATVAASGNLLISPIRSSDYTTITNNSTTTALTVPFVCSIATAQTLYYDTNGTAATIVIIGYM